MEATHLILDNNQHLADAPLRIRKPRTGMTTPAQNSIIDAMFRAPADSNYVISRWCFQQGLYRDFYWNAAQTIEKYLKASLLSNGRSAVRPMPGARTYGHDLEALFATMKGYTDDLVPEELVCPNAISHAEPPWRTEETAAFIARLNALGDPNNRYAVGGFNSDWTDLFKFDQVVFSLRRVSLELEGDAFIPGPDGRHEMTNRKLLRDHPQFMPKDGGLTKLFGKDASPELRAAALDRNLAFAPKDHEHSSFRAGWSSSNPILYIRIIEPSTFQQKSAELADLADWVVENIYLPPDARQQINEAGARLRP
ncbi:hypothetical protein B5K11_19965 [Rhizobium leguminosarum bv. trifolii]|nr:hypothetical protein B5K11_19965 [Rhizobium leguminosarum bv. trifolii]